MRRLVSCALLLLCAACARAQSTALRILEAGLNGEYVVGQPTSVRIEVSSPQPLTVELRVRSVFDDPRHVGAFGGDDTFTQQITLNAGERREFELPIFLPYANADMHVEVTATAPDGRMVASDRLPAKKLSVRTGEGNVGLLCAGDQVCKEAQQQAQFSGSMEERVDKNKKLHFITLQAPRAHWWPYSTLQSLVLAAPMSGYTTEQRAAIEDFVRRGGRLILLEKEAADADFLGPYRQGAAEARVSRGKLYRVASLSSEALGSVFTGGKLADLLAAPTIRYQWPSFRDTEEMNWFRRHAATRFTFPRLRWLLAWMSVYIVVIGLVNFAILRRLRKLEWGWLTILGGALVFAAGFYVSSSRQRPQQFTLDDLAVYWMDQRSANAYGEYGVRVSAPERKSVTLSVPGTAVLSFSGQRPTSGVNIGAEIREPKITPGMEVALGPPQRIEVPLLSWSFADHSFEGSRRFAGSLREVAPGRLRNETGVDLQNALFVDFEAKKIWTLGALASGAEVAVNELPSQPLLAPGKQGRDAGRREPEPFSLLDLARTSLFRRYPRMALGVSNAPALEAELTGIPYVKNRRTLLVVGFE